MNYVHNLLTGIARGAPVIVHRSYGRVKQWPLPARLAFIMGASAALWAAIILPFVL